MIALRRILVATDFGPASDTALRYGRELAGRFGAELHLLHAVGNVYRAAANGYGGGISVPPNLQEDIERSAKTQLDGLLSEEDRREFHPTVEVVTHDTPAYAIVDYARTHKIDLIVLGTHGRGAFAHLFMGSVAERVVRTAPCPVLTLRNPEHEFVLPDALVAVARA
jgi:nucleotide-binding universal stress UspA family protein